MLTTALTRSLTRTVVLLGLLISGASAYAQDSFRDTKPCGTIRLDQAKVPEDFAITFRIGPVQADRGTTTITKVLASGHATVEAAGWSRPGHRRTVETTKQRQLSALDLQKVYATVLACGFFELNQSYWNKNVVDGAVSSLDVTAGGKTHSVVIHHYPVTRFATIVSAVNEALAR